MLKINKLSVIIDNNNLLNEISLELYKGTFTSLIGASGSGKSLTALAIMGLLPNNAQCIGDILFNNAPIDKRLIGNDISMIFQEPMNALNPLLTCETQLVEHVIKHKSISKIKALELAKDWLEKVKIDNVDAALKKYPHQFSGGQKQRIMIAMAMITNPQLLIADEPTTALDVIVQREILELIKSLQQEYKLNVLMISHDIDLVNKYSDAIIKIQKGSIVNDNDNSMANINYNIPNNISSSPIIDIKDVNVYYNSNQVLFNINYTFDKGKFYGIIGGSGCGKTTLVKTLLNIIPISNGRILMNNKDITTIPAKDLARNVQIVFQDPYASLNPRLSIHSILSEVLSYHFKLRHDNINLLISETLLKVGLDDSFIYKYPHELSGGQRQRIAIARAIIVNPSILICDESIAALDINNQILILELIKALQLSLNLTILFITHDIKLVKNVFDEVVIMNKGHIIEYGSAFEVLNNPTESYSKELINAAIY